MTREEKFWSKVNKNGPTVREDLGPCWVWTGYTNKKGYGVLSVRGKAQIASRYSLELKIRKKLSRGIFACHRCDNPPCVNPEHIFAGTALDNGHDARAKKRYHHQKRTHCAKGHPFSGDNLVIKKGHRGLPRRFCKECLRVATLSYWYRGGWKRRQERLARKKA